MVRPLRLEFAGALYHVTSRGDRREDIYLDDRDREAWLEVVGEDCSRFNWVVHAYCQMTNNIIWLWKQSTGTCQKEVMCQVLNLESVRGSDVSGLES